MAVYISHKGCGKGSSGNAMTTIRGMLPTQRAIIEKGYLRNDPIEDIAKEANTTVDRVEKYLDFWLKEQGDDE